MNGVGVVEGGGLAGGVDGESRYSRVAAPGIRVTNNPSGCMRCISRRAVPFAGST